MGVSPERAARVEALFREVNERIAEQAAGQVDEATFVCECDDAGCAHPIHARIEHYDEVRSEPALFLVKPGHAEPSIERVVESKPGYDVVEKIDPRAAEVVEETDPR